MKIRYAAGGVVVGPDGRVVVVNQNGDSWSLPKGGLEPGETEENAARREIYEESGLSNLELIEELGAYERPTIGKGGAGEDAFKLKRITLFLFSTNQTELNPSDPDNPEAIWLDPGEVESKLTHQKDKEFYRQQLPKIERLRRKA